MVEKVPVVVAIFNMSSVAYMVNVTKEELFTVLEQVSRASRYFTGIFYQNDCSLVGCVQMLFVFYYYIPQLVESLKTLHEFIDNYIPFLISIINEFNFLNCWRLSCLGYESRKAGRSGSH